ncbi:MAG: hypothetical protein V7K47_14935 [Nostoc sp.]
MNQSSSADRHGELLSKLKTLVLQKVAEVQKSDRSTSTQVILSYSLLI